MRRFTNGPRFNFRGERIHSFGIGYRKSQAERAYDALEAKEGLDHAATHAALGRFIGLYGESFLEIYDVPIPEQSEALDRALNRESGVDGYHNKGWRKHHARTSTHSHSS